MLDFDKILEKTGIIAIVRGVSLDSVTKVMDALFAGGVKLAEITFDSTSKTSPERTAEIIRTAAEYMADKMLIGAGTVITEEQLLAAKSGGARFIISPNTDANIIRKTKELGLISLPGAMTVSEIVAASAAGADYVKLFPASVLGADFIKQVHGPLPSVKLLAVSGVSPSDIDTYINAGACGFGIGSAIYSKKLADAGDFEKIAENAKAFTDAYLAARGEI